MNNDEKDFYDSLDLKDRKYALTLMRLAETRGFSEQQLFVEFSGVWEMEHHQQIFEWSKWCELKAENSYFKKILNLCEILRKNCFLKIGMSQLIKNDKLNTTLYLAFMKNEFGWDKDKDEDIIKEYPTIKFKIVDSNDKELTSNE